MMILNILFEILIFLYRPVLIGTRTSHPVLMKSKGLGKCYFLSNTLQKDPFSADGYKPCTGHTRPNNYDGNLYKYCQAGNGFGHLRGTHGFCCCFFWVFCFFCVFLVVVVVFFFFWGGWSVVRLRGWVLGRVCQILHTTHSTH